MESDTSGGGFGLSYAAANATDVRTDLGAEDRLVLIDHDAEGTRKSASTIFLPVRSTLDAVLISGPCAVLKHRELQFKARLTGAAARRDLNRSLPKIATILRLII